MVTQDGYLKYSQRDGNIFGELPRLSYIKNKWARGEKKKRLKSTTPNAIMPDSTHHSADLQQMTIPQLQVLLKARNLKVSGKKQLLINRLLDNE